MTLDLALVVQNAVRQDGQGRAMLELARVLAGRGHRVALYAHAVDESLTDVEVHRLPHLPGPQLADDLGVLRAATAALRRRRFDAACVLGPTARPPCPTIYYAQFSHRGWRESWTRATRPDLYHRVHARALQALEDRCVRHADRVIALSDATAREIAGDTGTPVDVVPNGIDLEEFVPVTAAERTAARARLGVSGDAFVVGFLGDYATPRKGVEPLIRACGFAGVDGARLVIAGRGSEAHVRRVAATAGVEDRIVIPGFVPARDVIAAADTVAVPSLYEPFSLVAVEAAACGIPVLASARVGAASLLGDGVIVVDDPTNPSSLAAALTTLKAMGADGRATMGGHARSAATALSWDVTAGQAADIVESVAASRTVKHRA